MPRYVLLATVDASLVAPPPPDPNAPAAPAAPAAARADVVPEFAHSDPDGFFHFNIPAFDPATSNPIRALHVSLYEKVPAPVAAAAAPAPASRVPGRVPAPVAAPAAPAAPAIPSDPALIVQADLHYVADTSSIGSGGGHAVVDATDAPEGDYSAALVAEYAD